LYFLGLLAPMLSGLALLILVRSCDRQVSLESEPKQPVYAKVIRMNREHNDIELWLTFHPRETRFIFTGIPEQLAVGDYLKFSLIHSKAKVHGRELTLRAVTWITEP
jgi:hypothetical protein